MKNKFRILLALTLALVMVFGNVLTVVAEGEITQPIKVENGKTYVYNPQTDSWDEVEYSEAESITANDRTALYVISENNEDSDAKPSSFTVTGNVETPYEYDTHAVDANAKDSGTVDVTIQGSVTAKSENDSYPEACAINAEAEDTGSSVTIQVNGDVTASAKSPSLAGARAIYAEAEDGGTTNVTVNGQVSASANGEEYTTYEQAARVIADGEGSTADVTIGKGAEGRVSISAVNGGTANLTVQDGGVAGQVYVDANDKGTANLTIQAGGITSEVGNEALYLDTDYSTANVDITGDITSDDDGVYAGAWASKDAPALNDVQIKGNITSESENGVGVTALEVYSSGTGAVNIISVEGDITAESDSDAFASEFRTMGEGSEINATITGEIVATGGEDGYVDGVSISNYQGTQNITINGNVTATGSEESVGVDVMTYTDFYYTADADDLDDPIEFTFTMSDMPPYRMMGPVHIGDSEEPLYLIAIGEGDEKKYYVFDKNDATHDDDDITLPITIEIPDGLEGVPSPDFMPSSIKVKLRPISDYEIVVDEENPAVTELTIAGDVTSDTYGAAVYATPGTKTDIVIDGTVKGGDAGLVLMNDTELGNGVTLTVWAVELVDDTAVFSADMGYGAYGPYGPHHGMLDSAGGEAEETKKPTLTENKDAEAQLQYIIRVKADQKDIIAAAGDAFDYRGYKVAHENDTVTLKLNIPEGYEVVEAYSDQAQSMKLEKNEKGEYFLTVPRGGAVELSVKLNKLPDPEPDPEPEPKPDEPDTVAITYILGNDTANDHIRTTAAVGEGVALRPAPEREGYTFLYWQCTDVDPNSPYYKQPDLQNDFQFRPGAIYTAKKDINFVAVWQKN